MTEIKIDAKATEYLKDKIGGGSGSIGLYLHRIYLGNPTECDRIDFTMNIYNTRQTPYTDVNELEQYLVLAGINNVSYDPEEDRQPNGIICVRDTWDDLKSIIVRKFDEDGHWIIAYEGLESSYAGIEIYEDAVMTM